MLYHVSLFPVKSFYPRVPAIRCDSENPDIPRISFSQYSELDVLRAIPEAGLSIKQLLTLGICPTLYVYTLSEDICRFVLSPDEKANGIRVFECTEKYVPDADLSGECWVLDYLDMDELHCRIFYITDIQYDAFASKIGYIEDMSLTPCSNPESNLERLFSKFNCEAKLDDPRMLKFLYPGNENAFLGYALEVLLDTYENEKINL